MKHLCLLALALAHTIRTFAGDIDTVQEKKQPFWKTFKNPLEFKHKRATLALFPVCSYDPASGVEMGVMPVFSLSPLADSTKTRFYRASSIVNHLTYSTNNWANIRSDGQFFTTDGFSFRLFMQYLDAPDKFYGIGNDTLTTDPSSFKFNYFRFTGEASKSINQTHFLGFKVDFLGANVSEVSGDYLTADIYGYKGGEMIGLGPVYRYDSRDNVNFPTRGFYSEVSGIFYLPSAIDGYDCRNYTLDARKYFTLFKTVYVATQASVSLSDGEVPFYKLPTIGGKYGLRGISNKFMYIDKNAWLGQVEIRKMLFWRVGAVAFAGVGNNFDTYDEDIYRGAKFVYGFGGRLQMVPADKLNLRFDYGFGPNGDRGFYATVRESF